MVTGAASGLGQATAEILGLEGAFLGLADLQDTAKTQALLEAAGAQYMSFKIDVTNVQSVEDAAQQLYERAGRIDGGVNFAVRTVSARSVHPQQVQGMPELSKNRIGDMIDTGALGRCPVALG
jgi:NAD(P)-dependent dehydrogenase (short-subunit alcohol dehydrogenase family)